MKKVIEHPCLANIGNYRRGIFAFQFSTMSAIVCCSILLILAVPKAAAEFHDTFSDGDLTADPTWSDSSGYVVTNDPANTLNKVVRTPGGSARTNSMMAGTIMSSGRPLVLSVKFNRDFAGDSYWNSRWSIRTSVGAKSGFDWNSSGYGFLLGDGVFYIQRITKDGAAMGAPSVVNIAATTIPSVLSSGWNTADLWWGENGVLTLSINGSPVLNVTDTTHALASAQIVHIGFLNNVAASTGRALYFDDVYINEGIFPPPQAFIHPRISLTPRELPALRQRVLSGTAKFGYDLCAQRAGDLGAPPYTDNIALMEGGNILKDDARQVLSSAIQFAALAALISEDPIKISATKRALLAFVRGIPASTAITEFRAQSSRMDYARNLPGIALGYDWMYNFLTDSERQEVRQWLATVNTDFASYLQTETFGFGGLPSQHNYNWVPFITGAFGISALAIESEPGYKDEWYDKAKSSMMDYLEYGIGPGGSPTEGLHYLAYGMSQGIFFYDAMSRRGEVVFGHPHLSLIPTWWSYDLLPWGKDFNDLGDTLDIQIGLPAVYHRLAMAYRRDPVMQWVYTNYINSGSYTSGGSLDNPDAAALWGSTPETNITASALQMPTSRFFASNGLAYLRSGWGTEDIYLEFQSDPLIAGPSHAHADRNSFTLMGKGRMWAIDSGGWVPNDFGHNLVFIDGKAEGHFPHYGRIADYADKIFATGIMGDAKKAYDYQTEFENRIPVNEKGSIWNIVDGLWSKAYNPVVTANRSAILVRGTYPYAMIVDDIKKEDVAAHSYAWQMLSTLGNQFEALGANKGLLKPVDSGGYLQVVPRLADGSSPVNVPFNIAVAGNYRFWILMGKDYWKGWNFGATVSLDGNPYSLVLTESGVNSDMHWQQVWKVTPLSAGAHKLAVQNIWSSVDIRFAAVLVAPEDFTPVIATAPVFPPNSTLVRLDTLASIPNSWNKVLPETHPPQMLIQVLNPDPQLLRDSFADGNLVSDPTWANSDGFMIVNDPLNSGNQVMVTPGGTSRTVNISSNISATSSGAPLELNLRFNRDAAGDEFWDSRWSLRTTIGASSAYGANSPGYGFYLGGNGTTFQFLRYTKDGRSIGNPSETVISKTTLAAPIFKAGWNTVRFTWEMNGILSLFINGTKVGSATDGGTLFPPAFAQIANTSFVNNTDIVRGRVLYFDDIEVDKTLLSSNIEIFKRDLPATGDVSALRLKAEVNSVEPKFRVLLYPHRRGDPLPAVSSTSDSAMIKWPGEIDEVWTFGGFGTNGAATRVQRGGDVLELDGVFP